MEGSTLLIYPFLLLVPLPLCLATTDHVPVTGLSSPVEEPGPMGTIHPFFDSDAPVNGAASDTGVECLIDSSMAMVAVCSAGGVIVCLLVSTVVLACQVRTLLNRIGTLRPSHSNMDLVSSSAYWGANPAEAGGLEGPCPASIVLEEVRAAAGTDAAQSEAHRQRERELEQGGQRAAGDPEETAMLLAPSGGGEPCRDSQDLENTPLVV